MRTKSIGAGSLLRSSAHTLTVALSWQVTICVGSVAHQATPVTSPAFPCRTCGGFSGFATCPGTQKLSARRSLPCWWLQAWADLLLGAIYVRVCPEVCMRTLASRRCMPWLQYISPKAFVTELSSPDGLASQI